MIKRSYFALLLIFVVGLLTACTDTQTTVSTYTLPDLSGKTKENYTDDLSSSLITIVEKEKNDETIPSGEFLKYGGNLQAGDEVEAGTIIYVYFSLGEEIVDTEPPVIAGIDDIDIPYASTFDPTEGVTVIDAIDGDLKDRLIVTPQTINTFDFTEQTITYAVTDKSGNFIQFERTINIVPNEIDMRYTDDLALDTEYAGKNFVDDGIGVVTLNRCIDGDTAEFYDGTRTLYTRFLGIDTPESVGGNVGYDAWGKAASNYTCDVLENANIIVLEGEGTIKDTYDRYLGWVWVDGRLLNLELVEQAYTQAKGSSDSKYYDTFVDAERKTIGTGRRIWGEIDPNYDYDNHVFK